MRIIGDLDMLSPTLAQEVSRLEADFCSALSDPTRLLILYALAERPHNVSELAKALGISQPTLSRHLKILRERGLVSTAREGTTVTYYLGDRRLIEALDLLRAVMRARLARHLGLVKNHD